MIQYIIFTELPREANLKFYEEKTYYSIDALDSRAYGWRTFCCRKG